MLHLQSEDGLFSFVRIFVEVGFLCHSFLVGWCVQSETFLKLTTVVYLSLRLITAPHLFL